MSLSAMVAVREYSQQKSARYLTMIWIADALADDMGRAYIAVETLAHRAHLDVRNIHRYLNQLVASGELIIQEQPGKKSYYYIPILPDEPGYAPQACTSDEHFCNGMHTSLDVTRIGFPRKHAPSPGKRQRKRDGNATILNTRDGNATRGGMVDLPGGDGNATRGGMVDLPSNPNITNKLPIETIGDTPLSAKNGQADGRAEADPPLPPPPAQPPSQRLSPERRALWRATVERLARHPGGIRSGLHDALRSAHLFESDQPGVYVLRTGFSARRQQIAMYREQLHAALADELGRGNIVVEVRV